MEELLMLLNSNLRSIIIRKVLKVLFAKFAFLSWGPIGWIVEQIVENIVDIALKQINLLITDAVIDHNIGKDVDKVDEITDRLVEYEENKDDYTEEELDALDDELIDAYRDLFKF